MLRWTIVSNTSPLLDAARDGSLEVVQLLVSQSLGESPNSVLTSARSSAMVLVPTLETRTTEPPYNLRFPIQGSYGFARVSCAGIDGVKARYVNLLNE